MKQLKEFFSAPPTIWAGISGALLILLLIALFELTSYHTYNAPEETVQYLREEEAVVLQEEIDSEQKDVLLPLSPVLFEFIEVTDSCGPYKDGECLNVRSQPSTDAPVMQQIRNGVVLKVDGVVENNGMDWYRIAFDEWLRYPDRVNGDWYVSADFVEVLLDEGVRSIEENGASKTDKTIIVDRSDQTLSAYENGDLFMEEPISTGIELTPTPRGTFTVFRKTPSRYMQGPLPGISDKYYDLPGVPWNLYFTEQGAVIHGTYWHDKFGNPYSNGCVNMPPQKARELYYWAELGTKVIVRD